MNRAQASTRLLKYIGWIIVWVILGIAITKGQDNVRTKVTCGGGPEHIIVLVPPSHSGQRVATCRDGQKETWYDNNQTEHWQSLVKGLFVIRVAWENAWFDDQFYGPIHPGTALERLEFHPGGLGVPPQIHYKVVGGKLTVLNARPLAEVNANLDAGKESK